MARKGPNRKMQTRLGQVLWEEWRKFCGDPMDWASFWESRVSGTPTAHHSGFLGNLPDRSSPRTKKVWWASLASSLIKRQEWSSPAPAQHIAQFWGYLSPTSAFPTRKKKRTMEEKAKIVSFCKQVDFFSLSKRRFRRLKSYISIKCFDILRRKNDPWVDLI